MAPLAVLLSMMLLLNIGLGVFNLIPVPPLDGSHVLEELLPASMAEAYAQIRPYGFMLLYALMFIGVFGCDLQTGLSDSSSSFCQHVTAVRYYNWVTDHW